MKFISVRDFRGKSGEVWKNLPAEQEVVVTSNGRPVAILSAVNEANLEESLSAIRRARAAEAVMSLQRRSVERGQTASAWRRLMLKSRWIGINTGDEDFALRLNE